MRPTGVSALAGAGSSGGGSGSSGLMIGQALSAFPQWCGRHHTAHSCCSRIKNHCSGGGSACVSWGGGGSNKERGDDDADDADAAARGDAAAFARARARTQSRIPRRARRRKMPTPRCTQFRNKRLHSTGGTTSRPTRRCRPTPTTASARRTARSPLSRSCSCCASSCACPSTAGRRRRCSTC